MRRAHCGPAWGGGRAKVCAAHSARWGCEGARHTELLPRHTHTHKDRRRNPSTCFLHGTDLHILKAGLVSGTLSMHLGVRELGNMLGSDKGGPSDGSSSRLLSPGVISHLSAS